MIPRDRIGVSGLRGFTGEDLRTLREPLLVRRDEEPLAVIVPYGMFMAWQECLLEWPLKGIRGY